MLEQSKELNVNHVLAFVFGVPFALTRLMYFYAGFVERGATMKGDLAVGQLCHADGNLFARFNECPRYMAMGLLTQFWSGVERVWDNTSLCVFANCKDVLHDSVFDLAVLLPSIAATLIGAFFLIKWGRRMSNELHQPPATVKTLEAQPANEQRDQWLHSDRVAKRIKDKSGFEEVPKEWWHETD